MNKLKILLSVLSCLGIAITLYWWEVLTPTATDLNAEAELTSATNTSTPEKSPPTASDKPANNESTNNPDARLLAMGFTQQEIDRHRRQQHLLIAADNRFHEAVAADQLSAEKVKLPIRKLFKSLSLEPVLDLNNGAEGMIDGMQINDMSDRNPFYKAGFAIGDRLTSINGQPLQDPALVAHIFTGLDERFEVCAERQGDRLCRYLELDTE